MKVAKKKADPFQNWTREMMLAQARKCEEDAALTHSALLYSEAAAWRQKARELAGPTTLNCEIIKTTSRSGRRPMWYPTINGHRLTHTTYGRKWEAEAMLRAVQQKYSDAEIISKLAGRTES